MARDETDHEVLVKIVAPSLNPLVPTAATFASREISVWPRRVRRLIEWVSDGNASLIFIAADSILSPPLPHINDNAARPTFLAVVLQEATPSG